MSHQGTRVCRSTVVMLVWLAVDWMASPLPAAGPDPAGQPAEQSEALHRPLDETLDLYVRDGLVYYRALQLERFRLDRYIAALDVPSAAYDAWPRVRQIAFWINAYNAFVLRTVIDRYPIRGTSDLYPPNSIRQVPGAFDRLPHRAAGRTVTLDEIEQEILPAFDDPRVQFGLGRGAVGSPRLRSEAYTAGRLEMQLSQAHREFVRDFQQLRIDRASNAITVSPIIGWHEAEFIAAYGTGASAYPQRSPIERALLALISPHLYPLEREFVAQDTFTISYRAFDWRLNDLTGGRP